MKNLKIKICGMKHNVTEAAALQPDYLGFIFYDKSSRNYKEDKITNIPKGIKKVGVFVNQSVEEIITIVAKFGLDVIQLHGDQSSEFVTSLNNSLKSNSKIADNSSALSTSNSYKNEDKSSDHTVETPALSIVEVPALSIVEVWKVFSVGDTFDFSVLRDFENSISKFLFDTKGNEKGGNGYTFDWSVLKKYPSSKPFILSGGIGLTEISEVKKIQQSNLPIYGIDVNSKFEIKPGLKDVEGLTTMKELLALNAKD